LRDVVIPAHSSGGGVLCGFGVNLMKITKNSEFLQACVIGGWKWKCRVGRTPTRPTKNGELLQAYGIGGMEVEMSGWKDANPTYKKTVSCCRHV